MGNSSPIFVSVDGDDVGRHLEHLVILGAMMELSKFSKEYNSKIKRFARQLEKKFDAEIVFLGGDNLLVIIDEQKYNKDILDDMKSQFYEDVGFSLSLGVGRSSRDAYIALKLAKALGKNRIEEVLGGWS